MFISIATAVANNRTVNVQSDPIRDKKIYSTLYYSTIIVNEYCRRSNPSANKLRNIFNVKLLSLSRRDENCSRIEEKKIEREGGRRERGREEFRRMRGEVLSIAGSMNLVKSRLYGAGIRRNRRFTVSLVCRTALV